MFKIAAGITCLLGSGSVEALEVIAKCPSGITVVAKVDTRVKRYPLLARLGDEVERARVTGNLLISNDSSSTVQYSNREVLLAVGDDAPAQAYFASFASHVVDHGYIDLAPNESRRLSVYWPSTLNVGTKVSAVRFTCISLRGS